MTCQEARRQTTAPEAGGVSVDLPSHLASCPSCRARHAGLAAGLGHWRRAAAAIPVPPVEREWQAVRRARRSGSPGGAPLLRWLAWSAVPLTAAAAFALLATQPSARQPGRGGTGPAREVAAASSAVFVDEQSGWLVVWASEPGSAVSQ